MHLQTGEETGIFTELYDLLRYISTLQHYLLSSYNVRNKRGYSWFAQS